ncbi:MAG: DUF3185 domain-containing protein [Acidobacteriaceae bacterium]
MKGTVLAGILLAVLGCAALVYQGFTYTTHKTVFKLGPITANENEHHTVPLSPILGVAAVLGGLALVYVGRKN